MGMQPQLPLAKVRVLQCWQKPQHQSPGHQGWYSSNSLDARANINPTPSHYRWYGSTPWNTRANINPTPSQYRWYGSTPWNTLTHTLVSTDDMVQPPGIPGSTLTQSLVTRVGWYGSTPWNTRVNITMFVCHHILNSTKLRCCLNLKVWAHKRNWKQNLDEIRKIVKIKRNLATFWQRTITN